MIWGGEVVDYPYRVLAHAIIAQAADDWNRITDGRRAVDLPKNKAYREAEKKKIEEFFLSDYFVILAGDLDGEALLQRLRREADKRHKRWAQGGIGETGDI